MRLCVCWVFGCVCADGLIRAGGLRVEVVCAGYIGVGDFNVESLLWGEVVKVVDSCARKITVETVK